MASLSFQDAVKIIRENPKEADALAFESQEYFKTHPEDLPSDIPQSVLDGQTISEAYSYLREQHEDSQMREMGAIDQTKVPYELAAMPLLAAAFLQRSKILENGGNYQKIEEKLKKEWLKKNPGKDFSSKEGIDYLYGSLEDKTKNSIDKEAKRTFENNPKFKKRAERYSKEQKKVYKNPNNDQKWQYHEVKMQAEINARLELLEKNRDKKIKTSKEDIKKSREELERQVRMKCQRVFVEENPEKGNVYLKNIAEGIKDEKARLIEYNEGLMGETSAPEEETREAVGGQTTEEPHIVNTPSPVTNQITPPPQSSFPAQSSGAGINRGRNSIDGLNKLMSGGLKNPLGKFGSKAIAKTALRKGFFAFLVANPMVLGIAIALILVVFFTVMIVGFGGVPASTPDNQTTNTAQ